jgi:hypothetical protein
VSNGLEGLAVERVVRSRVGVKIVQLVTDDPDAARVYGLRVRRPLQEVVQRARLVAFEVRHARRSTSTAT